jgi:hypothetical protein
LGIDWVSFRDVLRVLLQNPDQAEPAQYILNVHQQLDVWHKTLKTWCKAHKQAKEHRHRSHGSDSSSTASTACCAGTREALKKAMEKAKKLKSSHAGQKEARGQL